MYIYKSSEFAFVRAYVRACIYVCGRASASDSVRACVRACVCACVCVTYPFYSSVRSRTRHIRAWLFRQSLSLTHMFVYNEVHFKRK